MKRYHRKKIVNEEEDDDYEDYGEGNGDMEPRGGSKRRREGGRK